MSLIRKVRQLSKKENNLKLFIINQSLIRSRLINCNSSLKNSRLLQSIVFWIFIRQRKSHNRRINLSQRKQTTTLTRRTQRYQRILLKSTRTNMRYRSFHRASWSQNLILPLIIRRGFNLLTYNLRIQAKSTSSLFRKSPTLLKSQPSSINMQGSSCQLQETPLK